MDDNSKQLSSQCAADRAMCRLAMSVWSAKVNRVIFNIFQYYSLAIGITAVRIDFARRRIRKSRAQAIYATCVNAALLVSIAPIFYHLFTRNSSENKLIRLTDAAYVTIHFGVILLMMGFRWQRERRATRLARELFALDRRYFDRLSLHGDIERRFNWLLLGKAFTIIVQILSSVFSMVSHDAEFFAFIVTLYYSNTCYIMHSIMFQYYSALWHVCKRLEILNAQLVQLQRGLQAAHDADAAAPTTWRMATQRRQHGLTLQHQSRLATTELSEVARIHWRLVGLVQRLCDNYLIQILALLVIYAIHNITTGYYAVLVISDAIAPKQRNWALLFGLLSYLIIYGDLYLFYRMCGATAQAYQQTAEILKELRTLPCMSAAYERCCERFSLQLMQRKLDVCMGGMCNFNQQTFLVLWSFIMRQSIILVQFDLETRLRDKRAKIE